MRGDSFFLQIKEPCHEDWNKMTPAEQGRHCEVCNKQVVDFTALSAMEISQSLSNNSNTCGRFRNDQLNRIYEVPVFKNDQGPKWMGYAALLSLGLMNRSNAQSVPVQTPDSLGKPAFIQTKIFTGNPVYHSANFRGHIAGISSGKNYQIRIAVNQFSIAVVSDATGKFSVYVPQAELDSGGMAEFGITDNENNTSFCSFSLSLFQLKFENDTVKYPLVSLAETEPGKWKAMVVYSADNSSVVWGNWGFSEMTDKEKEAGNNQPQVIISTITTTMGLVCQPEEILMGDFINPASYEPRILDLPAYTEEHAREINNAKKNMHLLYAKNNLNKINFWYLLLGILTCGIGFYFTRKKLKTE